MWSKLLELAIVPTIQFCFGWVVSLLAWVVVRFDYFEVRYKKHLRKRGKVIMLVEELQSDIAEKMNHRFDELKEQTVDLKEQTAKENRAIRRENRELKKMLKEVLANQNKGKDKK